MIRTRLAEEKMLKVFSEKKLFSEHLFKWEDPYLPDKYDHNCFQYTGQPALDEFLKAVEYQRKKDDSFIKLQGHRPLSDDFGLEQSITVTMELRGSCRDWPGKDDLRFAAPSIEELEAIEVKHYGPLYGEDFARRNVRRLYDKLSYHGAYIDHRLVAACYSFSSDGMVCIDGLIVDEAYRRQKIATTLLAHIVKTNEGSVVFLHADESDTPKDMYRKMGFEITDRLYEYSCLDLNDQTILT